LDLEFSALSFSAILNREIRPDCPSRVLGVFAGRLGLPNIVHRSAWRRIGGFIALSLLLVLILGLNLSFAHYRDVFTSGFHNPEQRALSEVVEMRHPSSCMTLNPGGWLGSGCYLPSYL
jgi:hypothetical protein